MTLSEANALIKGENPISESQKREIMTAIRTEIEISATGLAQSGDRLQNVDNHWTITVLRLAAWAIGAYEHELATR